MDINISLPDEIQTYVQEQLALGSYSTASEYFLDLVKQDQKRRAQEKLEALLLEGVNSEGSQEVIAEFWQQLRSTVLNSPTTESSESSEA
jgi:antitoxin ParD1/3/4